MPSGHVIRNATTTYTVPQIPVVCLEADGSSAVAQVFSAKIEGIGNCTATVQPMGSNDDDVLNQGGVWMNYGSTIAITGTSADITPGQGNATGTTPWKYIGAIVTAISGTQARVNVKVGW